MQLKQLGRIAAIGAGLAVVTLGQGRGFGRGFGPGPFGFGMFGPGAPFAVPGQRPTTPVTGLPFEATATVSITRPARNGGQSSSHQETLQLARDADGRTYIQTTMPAFGRKGGNSAASPEEVIFVNDPVARVSYTIYPARKEAIERQYPAAGGARAGRGMGAGPGMQWSGRGANRNQATTTSLGSQEIAGIFVTGTQRVTTLNPPSNASGREPQTITSKLWVSSDLHLVLEAQRSSTNGGDSDYTVQTLQQGPQNSSLFVVPSGYTIRPARGMRGRLGER